MTRIERVHPLRPDDAQPAPTERGAVGGMGEVWGQHRRLATVYYELTGRLDALLMNGAPILRDPQGTVSLLLGDGWTVLGLQEWGEVLQLADGQHLPFVIYGGAAPTLWIRGLQDLEASTVPLDGPTVRGTSHQQPPRAPTRTRRGAWDDAPRV